MKRWKDICQKYCIGQRTMEPHHPQQNPAKRRTRPVKQLALQLLDQSGAPRKMWLYALVLACALLEITSMPALNHCTTHKVAFGEMLDISTLVQYEFFDQVLFLDPTASFPADKEQAGRYLGVAENCGDALTYHIWTKESQQVITRSVVRAYDDTEDATQHPINMQEELFKFIQAMKTLKLSWVSLVMMKIIPL